MAGPGGFSEIVSGDETDVTAGVVTAGVVGVGVVAVAEAGGAVVGSVEPTAGGTLGFPSTATAPAGANPRTSAARATVEPSLASVTGGSPPRREPIGPATY
jgi:hypothetical protein